MMGGRKVTEHPPAVEVAWLLSSHNKGLMTLSRTRTCAYHDAQTHPVLSPTNGVQEASDHWESGRHRLQLASDIAQDAALILQIP